MKAYNYNGTMVTKGTVLHFISAPWIWHGDGMATMEHPPEVKPCVVIAADPEKGFAVSKNRDNGRFNWVKDWKTARRANTPAWHDYWPEEYVAEAHNGALADWLAAAERNVQAADERLIRAGEWVRAANKNLKAVRDNIQERAEYAGQPCGGTA